MPYEYNPLGLEAGDFVTHRRGAVRRVVRPGTVDSWWVVTDDIYEVQWNQADIVNVRKAT